MDTVRDICKAISEQICSNPICIETGSTYVIDSDNLVHTTTNNIAEYIVKKHNGSFWSFDIDPEHQSQAAKVCPDGIDIHFVLGNSVEKLKIWAKKFSAEGIGIDLLCLDSKEFDPSYMLKEYLAVENLLMEDHFVLIDDIHNPNSVKWLDTYPYLITKGYSFLEVNTPTGMAVGWRGNRYSL